MDCRSTFSALVVASTLWLVGCQQQAALSLDEAKKITTTFQGQEFTPPPRSISDITAILDQQKPDPVKAAANRAAADREPPAGTAPAEVLTTDTFHRQATNSALSRAVALQQALDLIDDNGLVDAQQKTVFSYAHPIFWAPFSLVVTAAASNWIIGQRSGRDVVS